MTTSLGFGAPLNNHLRPLLPKVRFAMAWIDAIISYSHIINYIDVCYIDVYCILYITITIYQCSVHVHYGGYTDFHLG